jgi:hypothetical protein
MFRWHQGTHSAIIASLKNEEWTSRRNGLTVLTSIVEHFPVIQEQYKNLYKSVTELRDKETREDLKKLAQVRNEKCC